MIDLQHLSFNYQNNESLFRNMDLQISDGGICGLLGKNGAGKTTLLKIIAGLVFPTDGNCQIMNHTPSKREPSFLNDVYYLPEDLYVPALSAETYVKFYSAFYPRFDNEQFQNFLKEFDIAANKVLTTLSHGQKKKFLIAFGLATNCRLFLLDEPTNGLDIPSKAQFRKLLASTTTDDKLFIISTHQVHDVENLIDTILVLNEGDIIFQQSLLRVTQELAFSQQKTEPNIDMCIYSEKQLNGYNTIMLNKDDRDTHVDLEMLFNAILTKQKKIQAIFEEVK
jgi:ABC-2 type transport system ATP-binding protein